MCGIGGQFNLKHQVISNLNKKLELINKILAHRGPDGTGTWIHPNNHIGLTHRRLSIIDLDTGKQPMSYNGITISYNGEIYNYKDLRSILEKEYVFHTKSDTEIIIAAYLKWGISALDYLRGMFAFILWDDRQKVLYAARDRFGIKPLYYAHINDNLILASEAKALLPFLNNVETDYEGLQEYFAFQFCLGEKTLFKNIQQLQPGHFLVCKKGKTEIKKYWEVEYNLDWNHTKDFFQKRVRSLIEESINYHLVSDVPIGCYLSGGLDSSLVATLAKRRLEQSDSKEREFKAFTGKFSISPEYDESPQARVLSELNKIKLHEIDISCNDFIENIYKVIYHLDYPVAGPGSFPQFMVSQVASKHLKVCLGGQGGDEIFGGYVRYILAYFEQCLKGAIDGTMHSGNFIVTYESIIPNLKSLQRYKPLMKEFWKSGLFDDREKRYFKLINRSEGIKPIINPELVDESNMFEKFNAIFCGNNVAKGSYFDNMTNFDFKTLLPALLQVEDRVSMAHGLESRVPFLDHPLIEFVATIPSNVKFEDGALKRLLRETCTDLLPNQIINSKDKLGFPVPLAEWIKGDLYEFVVDILSSQKAIERGYLKPGFDAKKQISKEGKFDRSLWGILSLELWQQQFHDSANKFTFLE